MSGTARTSPRTDASLVRVLVNGFEIEAVVNRHLVDEVLLPRLAALAAERPRSRRTFAFLVAPPGAGKSTLAAVLVERARRWSAGALDLDAVGIDGFHHPNAFLETHVLETADGEVPLSEVKGAPETFDVQALSAHLEAATTRDLAWPVYDRTLHDVVPARQQVTAGVVLVEGNWLLLDEPGWSDLAAYSAFTVFVDAEPDLLRQRLIDRKVRGGLTPDAAADFYDRSDRLNVERVLRRSDRSRVDLLLHLRPDGTIDEGVPQ